MTAPYPLDKRLDGCVCGAVFEARCGTVPGKFSYWSIIRYRPGDYRGNRVFHIGQKAYVTACWKRHVRRCLDHKRSAEALQFRLSCRCYVCRLRIQLDEENAERDCARR